MSKIPETNTTDYLCTLGSYKKKQLKDRGLIERMLIREIKTACRAQGYRLVEIKIEEL